MLAVPGTKEVGKGRAVGEKGAGYRQGGGDRDCYRRACALGVEYSYNTRVDPLFWLKNEWLME